MPITDKLTKANNGVLAVPTTLASSKATGVDVVDVALSTGWPQDSTDGPVHLTIFKTVIDATTNKPIVSAGTQTFWKATLSGTTLSNMQIKGGTNQPYEVGDVAIINAGPGWENDLIDGLLVTLKRDGSLKDNIVGRTNIQNKAVDFTKIDGGTNAGVLVTDANGNVTIRPKDFFAILNNGTSSRSVTSSDTYVMVPGYVEFVNPLSIPLTVEVTSSIMIHDLDNNAVARAINDIRDTNNNLIATFGVSVYHSTGQTWLRHSITGRYTVPAGTTVRFGQSFKRDGGAGLRLEMSNNNTTDPAAGFSPTISGKII